MNYNLGALDPIEFESLAKDILSIVRPELSLHVYGEGKDNGIDICTGEISPLVVGQAKRYVKSGWESLKSVLISESEKIRKLKPIPEYYLFTTLSITGSEKAWILNTFNGIIHDADHIYAGSDIDEFLKRDSPQINEIIRKHLPLYLASTQVLKLLWSQRACNRADSLKDEISRNCNLFFPTTAFKKASQFLADKRAVILIGHPGSGKTITSNMLLSNFLANHSDYEIVYGRSDEAVQLLGDIVKGKAQIIYVDDVLGSAHFDLSGTNGSTLEDILRLVRSDPSKRLLLNSRTSVIEGCRNATSALTEELDSLNFVNCTKEMTDNDKAFILYKQLFFRNVRNELLQSVCENKGYLKIVNHPNYSPRLLEFATSEKFISTRKTGESYLDAVLALLNKPDAVWEDEIAGRCSPEDRLFLYTLYSCGKDHPVPVSALKAAFNLVKGADPQCDATKKSFDHSLGLLNEEAVSISYHDSERQIAFANPSIAQYVSDYLHNDEAQGVVKLLLNNAKFLDQFVNLFSPFSLSKIAKEMAKDHNILSCPKITINPSEVLLTIIAQQHLWLSSLEKDVKQAVLSLDEGQKSVSPYSIEMKALDSFFHSMKGDPFHLADDLVYGNIFGALLETKSSESQIFLYELIFDWLPSTKQDDFKERFYEDAVKTLHQLVLNTIDDNLSSAGDDFIEKNCDQMQDNIDETEDYLSSNYQDFAKDAIDEALWYLPYAHSHFEDLEPEDFKSEIDFHADAVSSQELASVPCTTISLNSPGLSEEVDLAFQALLTR